MAGKSEIETKNSQFCDEDIVISGMSGTFPASSNVDEFEYNLYNKINMVDDEETRFQHTNPLIPRFLGKVPNVSRFDADFFGVPEAEANNMDPQSRLLVEEAFKAVVDAGVNPTSLHGSNIGVYVGSSISETEANTYSDAKDFLFGITGCRKAMFANRISYALGLNGPSLVCDTACSSSIYAMDLALSALKNGNIDAAIVGGANVCLHKNIVLQFAALGVLSANGVCRPFDTDANGYTRSEAVACFFLQRKSAAKRIYATCIGAKANCDGFKNEGITYPSSVIQEKLLREIYARENIDFNELGYVEAHSTATIVGDPEECKAIDNAIARRRSKPLLVGSVKSNCGHAEPAAGICSITKVLLAMNSGLIAPNINYKTMKSTIEGLKAGRLLVVTNTTALTKPYVGINSFGFGGANAHVILKQYEKPKAALDFNAMTKQPYRLVTWCGRTNDNVSSFLTDLEKRPIDFEYLALAQASQVGGIKNMRSRGYSLLLPNDERSLPMLVEKKIQTPKKTNRAVVWVFSGIGAHWHGMAKSLMQLPLFEKSMQKCHSLLDSLGLNLREVIMTTDSKALNTVQSFVGIISLQIALTDVLKELGVCPDFLVGQSIGELACAYADGSLTAKEALLAAFYCGKLAMESVTPSGAMALINDSCENIKATCPKNITISGYYSKEYCLISGPKSSVASFISSLKAKNIYSELLENVNIGFHANTFADVVPKLLKSLKYVIPQPKMRSKTWLSTSVTKNEWLQQNNRFSSPEYFANNLQSAILFEQTLPLIPKSAVIVEMGPSAFSQSIWPKKTPHSEHLKLLTNDTNDTCCAFLKALGSLYINGVELSIGKLYPKVKFPVSRGTRCLSSAVDFDHTKAYSVYTAEPNVETSGMKTYSINSDAHQYLTGHEIDGRILLPATFYIECVWRTLAAINNQTQFEAFAVEFRDVKFERATTFPQNGSIELMVVIHFGSGKFEITESKSLVASGFVQAIKNGQPKPVDVSGNPGTSTAIDKRAFYKELKLRGYHYKDDFQSVEMAQMDGSQGKIKWIENWVAFMDCMLQLTMIGQDCRNLMLPTQLRLLRIYPQYHSASQTKGALVEANYSALQKRIVAGGIEMIDLKASAVQRRRSPAEPVLENYRFVSHLPAPKMSLTDISRCCIQIVLENQARNHLQITELATNNGTNLELMESLKEAVSDLPLITGNYAIIYDTPKSIDSNDTTAAGDIIQLYSDDDQTNTNPNIVVFNNENTKYALQTGFVQKLDQNDFLIERQKSNMSISNYKAPDEFAIVAYFPSDNEAFILLRKHIQKASTKNMEILNISDDIGNFDWIKTLQAMYARGSEVLLVAQGVKYNGILGLTNCLRKEPETKNTRCVFINDFNCPNFDANLPLFAEQLEKNLAINIFKKGCWGTYRHLKLTTSCSAKAHEEHVFAHMTQIGDFSSLQWFQGPLTPKTGSIKIVYSSLNFRDVMQASGRLPITFSDKSRIGQQCPFGFEFSGVDEETGKRIMGMTELGAVSSHLRKSTLILWEVPKHWSLQEAATVPVVYLTVYYAYFYTADIRKGKTILIHAGSGGVGIAAIRVALAYGLEVFTTVSTVEKRNFLLKTFPALKESNIGNSRDNTFEDMIMKQTNGKGVDYVLNSLSEDKLKTSIRCLGKCGHFLEIGKYDMANDNPLEMAPFLNGLKFSAVLADNLLKAEIDLVETIKQHMIEDTHRGIIQPLPTTVYKANEVEQSFRYLMSGKHIGKVLLQVRKDEQEKPTLPITVMPLVYFSPDEVYIMPGGLGGFGLELVDWMILRGARKFVLSSSRGISNDYQKFRIRLWKTYGCEIVINTSDIGSMDGCLDLLTVSMKMGPVGGIFNLAVLLKDAVFPNQNEELFQESMKPKAYATSYLDQLSRQLCPKLQYFVVFSSVSCGRGNAGQTNYGMANSIMERIMEERVADGLPGKAVQWGAVGEVGLVAEMAEGKIDLEIGGTLQQRISSCLHVLDELLISPDAVVSSMVVAEKKASSSGQTPLEFVLNVLSISDIKSISMNSKLAELGLDSLTSVEIKQTFERDYGIVLNTADLRALTFAKLTEISENAAVVSETTVVAETEQNNFIEHLRQFYGQLTEMWDVKTTFVKINEIEHGNPIVVLPGIDGCGGAVWKTIGKNLNTPAYVIQYREIGSAKTLNEIVDFCAKNIAECLQAHKSETFQIIGYSLGGLIAHCVTAALECQGLQGKVILIDSSPQMIQNLTIALGQIYVGIELEKIVLSTILSLILPNLEIVTMQRDLRNKLFREEIFKYLYDNLTQHNYPKIDEMMTTIEAVYQRLKIIQNSETYANIDIVDAEILLLKPTMSTIVSFDEYYGLSPFTRNRVQTEVLDGNHQSILQNVHLPNIVEKYFNL